MDDLISRQAFKEECLKLNFFPALIASTLKKTPAVDATQVVRCKNCKYYDEHFNPNTKNYCYVDGGLIHRIMPPDGFCSDGKKKNNE